MPVASLHGGDADVEPIVFGDLAADPQLREHDMLYCDVAQYLARPGPWLVVAALPSPRMLMFLTRSGVRDLGAARSVGLAVQDAAHARLCICVLRACGLDPAALVRPQQADADVLFAACNSHELRSLRQDPSTCSVPYAPDLRVLAAMLPHLRTSTVFLRDWLPKCTAPARMATLCVVDTLLCARGTTTRGGISRVLRRFRSAMHSTAFVASRVGEAALHPLTRRLLRDGALVEPAPAQQPPQPRRVLRLDASAFYELYLGTRDGSGKVFTLRDPGGERPRQDEALLLMPASGATGPKAPALLARVTGGDAAALRISVPPQPGVVLELQHAGAYKCVAPDPGLKQPVGRLTRAACEREGVYVWDRPCMAPEDCPFAGHGCEPGGYCRMPPGVSQVAYRRFRLDNTSYPVCDARACDPARMATDLGGYIACCSRKMSQ